MRAGDCVASGSPGEDIVDAGGVSDPGGGGQCYEAEHGLDVITACFERQVPDALVWAMRAVGSPLHGVDLRLAAAVCE
jgi:hypothetical protein